MGRTVQKVTKIKLEVSLFPYSYIYAAVPVGIVMMLFSYASAIPQLAKQYAKGEK